MINNSKAAVARGAGVASAFATIVAIGAGACRKPDVTDGRYQGMIELDQRDLAFENPGRVVEVKVTRGQQVNAGDVIARQDDSLDRDARGVDARAVAVAQSELALVKAGSRAEDIRAAEAQLASAKAAEVNAQTELNRQRTLVDKGALPAAGLDALVAQLAAATGNRQAQEEKLRALRKGARAEEITRAEARVEQAQQALSLDDRRIEKRTLVAPTAGEVEELFVQTGEMASAGVPLLSLIDVQRPYADVFVPVPDAPHVKVGDAAHLRVEGLPDEASGTVELIYPQAEFTPRFVFSPRERPNLMVRVRVRVDDPDRRLHAGLPAYVTFGTATASAAKGAPR